MSSPTHQQVHRLLALITLVLPASFNFAHALVPLHGVASIGLGDALSTCAVTASGGAQCWGANPNGGLGDNTTIPRMLPGNVSGLTTGVARVDIGGVHTCALTTGGGVKCWGGNSLGQLGDGTQTQRLVPVNVIGLASGVTSIATGFQHTCALTAGGGVKCWGYNALGQLGNASAGAYSLLAVDVTGLTSGVTAIAAGANQTCALVSAGVKCWGNYGFAASPTPVDIAGVTTGIAAITVGGDHGCALTSAGGAKCWGGNAYGQLGDGAHPNSGPVDVTGLTSGVTAITAGTFFTCAMVAGGGVKCWGDNRVGQLGDWTVTQRLAPTDVTGLASGVVSIGAANGHACALMISGDLQCWGDNSFGQLGDNTLSVARTPQDVFGLAAGVSVIAPNSRHTCAVVAGGAKCWGYNQLGQLGNNAPGALQLQPVDVIGLATGVATTAVGLLHSCAVTATGGVQCWGNNGYGQLGVGNLGIQSSPVPVDVLGLANGVIAVVAGENHTCALTGSGGVKCWGQGNAGELGNGATVLQQTTPVDVSGLTSGVIAISSSYHTTCALTSVGGVKCWGHNSWGQIGDGNSGVSVLVPADVVGLASGVTAITAGANHTCALLSGGMKCWGMNNFGEIGDGTLTQRLTPVDVSGLTSGVVAISAGDYHTCAVTTSGAAKCWGRNDSGQLGDDTNTQRMVPTNVVGLSSGAAAVFAAAFYSCTLTTSGAAKCWGANQGGQTGDGTFSQYDASALIFRGARSFPAEVLVVGASQIAVKSVNSGVAVGAGANFTVVVESRDNGAAAPVQSSTQVTLTLTTGTGPLMGTPSCIIPIAGTTCSINGLSLSTLQTGAGLTASVSSGDALAPGSSAPFDVVSNPPAFTTTVVTTSGSPSVTGQSVTFTATVSGGSVATGSVGFSDGATPIAGCTASSLNGSGQAQCVTTSLGIAGSPHTINAAYAGDVTHVGSNGSVSQTVGKAGTFTAIASDDPDPSVAGSAITVAVNFSVIPPGGGTPAGTVTVSDSQVSCQITLPANSCMLTPITTGARTLTATYGGSGSYFGSASFGEPHQVTLSCTYSLLPTDLPSVAKTGGLSNIVVTTPAGCPVTATSFQPWVVVSSITPNGATTTVSLQINANPGAARATSIVVAGRLFLITQLAGP